MIAVLQEHLGSSDGMEANIYIESIKMDQLVYCSRGHPNDGLHTFAHTLLLVVGAWLRIFEKGQDDDLDQKYRYFTS